MKNTEGRRVGIVPQAFGAPWNIRSNKLIAEIAFQKSCFFGGASIYTQADVQFFGKNISGINVERVAEIAGHPPVTIKLMREAIIWAIRHELKELWLVCAEPHYKRCWRDLNNANKEAGFPVEVFICEELFKYPLGVWFCLNSTQKRTQTKGSWYLREYPLNVIPFWFYDRVCNIIGN